MKEELDAAQDVGVTNHLLSEGTSMDIKALEEHLGVAKSMVHFVMERQTEDYYHWENMFTLGERGQLTGGYMLIILWFLNNLSTLSPWGTC